MSADLAGAKHILAAMARGYFENENGHRQRFSRDALMHLARDACALLGVEWSGGALPCPIHVREPNYLAFRRGADAMRREVASYANGIAADYDREPKPAHRAERRWSAQIKAAHWRILAKAAEELPLPVCDAAGHIPAFIPLPTGTNRDEPAAK